MDRFFDRLGDVIKNFLDDEDDKVFGRGSARPAGGDPDLDAAYEELDDFLKGGKTARPEPGRAGSEKPRPQGAAKNGGIPEALRADFQELSLPFGAGAADCKAAYKKLLKIHHPDRHAGHEGNMKKATAKAARINASYRRIEAWRETGRIEQ
ncbi:MAG TPA: J domain-containing protein [Treponema sp.]|nr:MAG: molecular chaperone DnaJ [Treponema sp. GWC1_61_84]HCM27980.1 J domain-containing protein [Treponema sp.]